MSGSPTLRLAATTNLPRKASRGVTVVALDATESIADILHVYASLAVITGTHFGIAVGGVVHLLASYRRHHHD